MSVLLWLVPLSVMLAGLGLWGLFWSIKNDQFDDPKGAAERILLNDENRSS